LKAPAKRLSKRFRGLVFKQRRLFPNDSRSKRGFQAECEACLCEAEDAEEKELRAASNRKMAAAAEEDAVSLQLPDSVAQQVFFLSTGQDLDDAEQHLRQLVRQNGSCDDIFGMLATKGRALGLDAEWKPFLEKRLGLPGFAYRKLVKIELFAFSLHLCCMFFTAAKLHIPSPFEAGRHAKASKEY